MMEHALIEYIVNALWQVPLIAAAAWLLARLVKPGPRLHHGLWLASLGLALLLPARGLLNLSPTVQQNLVTVTNRMAARRDEGAAEIEMPARRHVASGWSPQIQTVRLATTSAHWLVRLYLASIMLGLLRIARAWRATQVLVAHSQQTSRHKDMLSKCSRGFKAKLPEIRESREVASPIIVGMTAPILLLPEGFERFAKEEIEATLCHELAHVQRRDYAVNIVCQVAALPLIWHPVIGEIQQRIRLTRELVCDAMAAQEMKSEISYAKCLLALANSMLGARSSNGPAHLVGLFTNNNLEERVMQLVETTKMNVAAKLVRMAAGAAVTIASLAIASSFHVRPLMAQSKDVPPFQAQTVPDPPTGTASAPTSSILDPPAVEKQQDAHHDSAHAQQRRSEKPDDTDTEPRIQIEDANEFVSKHEFKKQIESAQREAMKAEAFTETPEFKKQMEEVKKQMEMAQQQAMNASVVFDSPEFKKQMDEVQRQAAKAKAFTETPEFKKQMDEVQRQAAKAKAFTETPEFKKQMDELKQHVEEAEKQSMKAKAFTDSPEFQKQMEDARRQAAKAMELFNTPEFKQEIEDVAKQADKVKEMLESLELKGRIENQMPETQTGEAP